MGGNFCQILELGGTTIKGRRVYSFYSSMRRTRFAKIPRNALKIMQGILLLTVISKQIDYDAAAPFKSTLF